MGIHSQNPMNLSVSQKVHENRKEKRYGYFWFPLFWIWVFLNHWICYNLMICVTVISKPSLSCEPQNSQSHVYANNPIWPRFAYSPSCRPYIPPSSSCFFSCFFPLVKTFRNILSFKTERRARDNYYQNEKQRHDHPQALKNNTPLLLFIFSLVQVHSSTITSPRRPCTLSNL